MRGLLSLMDNLHSNATSDQRILRTMTRPS
jgi:hypothetical protein